MVVVELDDEWGVEVGGDISGWRHRFDARPEQRGAYRGKVRGVSGGYADTSLAQTLLGTVKALRRELVVAP